MATEINNIISYVSSWSSELKSRENRIRNLIGQSHWLSDGNHKENVIRDIFSRYVPRQFTLGHGFVRSKKHGISNEVDILITNYLNSVPYFDEGGLQIVPPDCVSAAIEVKTKPNKKEITDAVVRSLLIERLCFGNGFQLPPWIGAIFYDDSRKAASILDTLCNVLEKTEFGSLIEETDMASPQPLYFCVLNVCAVIVNVDAGENNIKVHMYATGDLSFGYMLVDLMSHLCAFQSGNYTMTNQEVELATLEYEHEVREIKLR